MMATLDRVTKRGKKEPMAHGSWRRAGDPGREQRMSLTGPGRADCTVPWSEVPAPLHRISALLRQKCDDRAPDDGQRCRSGAQPGRHGTMRRYRLPVLALPQSSKLGLALIQIEPAACASASKSDHRE